MKRGDKDRRRISTGGEETRRRRGKENKEIGEERGERMDRE